MAFVSPKRKRSEDARVSPTKLPSLLTRFSQIAPDAQGEDGGSPRTQVAGKFQDLDISHYALDEHPNQDVRLRKRPHYDDEVMESSQDSTSQPQPNLQQLDGPGDNVQPHQPPTAEQFTFERAISMVFRDGEPSRPKSPSLKGEVSEQYWHESEITGNDPNDPDDDGYGINGIGFKPSSAMAHARTQKRKQQITEYRNREAKEARQRRSERRRGASGEVKNASPTPDTPRKSKVRFQEMG